MELCSQISDFTLNMFMSKDLFVSDSDGSRFATVLGTIFYPPFLTSLIY